MAVRFVGRYLGKTTQDAGTKIAFDVYQATIEK